MQFKRRRVDVFRRKNEKRLVQDDRSGDSIGQDGEVSMRKCRDLTPGGLEKESPQEARWTV